MDRSGKVETDRLGEIDAIAQNEREQRAGAGGGADIAADGDGNRDSDSDSDRDRADPGQQRSRDEERRDPGQQTGGTGGAGAPTEPGASSR